MMARMTDPSDGRSRQVMSECHIESLLSSLQATTVTVIERPWSITIYATSG